MYWLDRLNQMKRESKKTTSEIAVLSGIPIGTLNKLFSGQTKDPQLGTVRAVVHCFGYTLDDLDENSSASKEPEAEAKTKSQLIAEIMATVNEFDNKQLKLLLEFFRSII